MTVKELIDELSSVDGDLPLVIATSEAVGVRIHYWTPYTANEVESEQGLEDVVVLDTLYGSGWSPWE